MTSLTHTRRQNNKAAIIPTTLRPIREVAIQTGIPARTLRRWAKEGRIDARRQGPKLWYIDPKQAQALSLTLKPGPTPKNTHTRLGRGSAPAGASAASTTA
jgi:hypothetical protein